MPRRELLFVYNAKSGTLHALLDAAHKLLSPSTYACHLCALTYGAARMRPAWRDFVHALPHEVRFIYADELARENTLRELPALPALLERRESKLVPLLAKADIEACKTLDGLMARVREALEAGASAPK